jgi:hypothetical protein
MTWLSEAHASASTEQQELHHEAQSAKELADALKAQVARLETELARAEARAASAEAQLQKIAEPDSGDAVHRATPKGVEATNTAANETDSNRTHLVAEKSRKYVKDEEVAVHEPSSPANSISENTSAQHSKTEDFVNGAVVESTDASLETAAREEPAEVSMLQGIQGLWTTFTTELTPEKQLVENISSGAQAALLPVESSETSKKVPLEELHRINAVNDAEKAAILAATSAEINALRLEKEKSQKMIMESAAENKKARNAAEATLALLQVETEALANQQAAEYEESLQVFQVKEDSLENDLAKKEIAIVELNAKVESLSAEQKTAVQENTRLEAALQHAEDKVAQMNKEASLSKSEYQTFTEKMENAQKEASTTVAGLLQKVDSLESSLKAAYTKIKPSGAELAESPIHQPKKSSSKETDAIDESIRARKQWLQEHLADALEGYDARRESLESKLFIAQAKNVDQTNEDLSGLIAAQLALTTKVNLLTEYAIEASRAESARSAERSTSGLLLEEEVAISGESLQSGNHISPSAEVGKWGKEIYLPI